MADLNDLQTRVEALETLIDGLKSRLQILEKDDDGEDAPPTRQSSSKKNSKRKESKNKGGKKSKGKSSKGGKKTKGPKITEKKTSSRRKDRDRHFYHAMGHTVYVEIPLPFKYGDKIGKAGKTLSLQGSFGYNGSVHQNLIAQGDELAYCLAAVGVILDPVSLEQRFFEGHTEDIMTIAKNPQQSLIATGQRDPKDGVGSEDNPFVCIWETKTMEEQKRIRYGAREVHNLGFSQCGKFLFVIGGDDSHTGGWFDWENNCEKPVWEHMTSKDDIYGQVHSPKMGDDNEFHFLTYGKSVIKWWVYAPEADDDNRLKTVQLSSYGETKVSQSAYYCALFEPQSGNAIVGTHSGHVYIFARSGQHSLLKHYKVADNTSPVVGITLYPDPDDQKNNTCRVVAGNGSVFMLNHKFKVIEDSKYTCGHKGITAVVDIGDTMYIGTKNQNIVSINHADDEKKARSKCVMRGHKKEMWCLATHPTEPWVCMGADDKVMRVWDYNTMKVAFSKKSKHGFRCADFSRDGKYLAVGCLDGTLTVIDCTDPTGDFVYEKKIAAEQISAIAFSADHSKIVLGSWDQKVRILNTHKWKSKVMKGHTSSITHICMSVDTKWIQSVSKDGEILCWDCSTHKRTDDCPADTIWDRFNSVLGWNVQGLFHRADSIDDVNCCAISGDNNHDDNKGMKIVVSGDDTGHVTVFKYPILQEKPSFTEYMAHSAHVTNTRFSSDDEWLFSIGGGDGACFKWKVEDL